MIHPPDVIEKFAPDAVIGMLGGGSGEAEADDVNDKDEKDREKQAGAAGGCSMEEAATLSGVMQNGVHGDAAADTAQDATLGLGISVVGYVV